MKVAKKDGTSERRVLTACIVSREVLAKVAENWDEKEGSFASSWANLIGQWCVDYHEKYKKAPGKDIHSLFESWAADHDEADTVESVDKFLSSLSEDYVRAGKEINVDLMIDMAGELFNKVKLTRHKDQIEGDLENGKVAKALERFNAFKPVEMGKNTWIDPLRDEEAMRRAFESKGEPLVTYPGALGEFFGNTFERDAFVSFLAPEKRGKSYDLLDVGYQALKQGRKVAIFEVGDLSQNQMMLRMARRFTRRPLYPTTDKPLKYPILLEREEGDEEDRRGRKKSKIVIDHEERRFDEPLTWRDAMRANKKIIERLKTDETLLRLSCHSNSSISAKGILTQVDRWCSDGWEPDFVIIDYADILAAIVGIADTRDEINATWKMLRRLSQDYHCCVVTATQSDAEGYEKKTLTKKNFSNDKRKLAHVTAMIGINQTANEKKAGMQRLNYIVLREEEYVETKCVHVAGCIGIASPWILSSW